MQQYCPSCNPDLSARTVDGILNVNKPAGITSFGVVSVVRRLSGCRRAGHCGTLDPDATGVLVVCLGQATKLTSILTGNTKEYRAEIALGSATDTYDATGKVTFTGDCGNVTQSLIEQVLQKFRGKIMQTPPAYSALKVNGRRLYDMARAGVEVNIASRPVEVTRLQIVCWMSPVVTVHLECSKGTYVRSLAHDLGKALGCGAHLKSLIRTRSGNFRIEDSITLDEFEAGARTGYWHNFISPMDMHILAWPAVILDGTQEANARNGRPISLSDAAPQKDVAAEGERNIYRAYSVEGAFIALLEYDQNTVEWRSRAVFPNSTASWDRESECPFCQTKERPE